MNRRSFLGNLALGTAAVTPAVTLFSRVSKAQTTPIDGNPPVDCPPPVVCPPPPAPLKVHLEILNNHGHAGTIVYESVIIGNSLTMDIQGTSGHPHTLILTEDDLAVLRKTLTVDVKSSVDFGHAHMVRITRDLIP